MSVQRTKKRSLRALKSIIAWIIALSVLTYFVHIFDTQIGLTLFFAHWSLIILCIPAGHGQWLFGYPIRQLTGYNTYPELILLPCALFYSASINIIAPEILSHSFGSMILYRLLNVPNPYWTIFCVSAIGTVYFYCTKQYYFARSSVRHGIIRSCIIFGGIIYFCCIAHKEFIILLNAAS